jgi:hypothetical protein
MPDTYKLLYQGQLPSSVGTLATVGTGKMWIIKHITVVNNDASSRAFALYRQGTAAANIITPPAMAVPAGGMAEWDGTLSMNDAETLRGVASVASMLTVTIDGDEVS